MVQSRPQRLLLHAVLKKTLKGLFNQLDESFPLVSLRVFRHDGKIGLFHVRLVKTADIRTDSGIQKRLSDRRAGGAYHRVRKRLKSHAHLSIQIFSERDIVGKIGVPLLRFALHDRIFLLHKRHLLERRLCSRRGIHRKRLVSGQILPVKISKPLLHIHIPIEIDITVGGMIIFLMKSQKILVSKLRNHVRVSPRLHRIGGMGIKGVHNLPVQHVVRRRKRPLHFIVDHTVDRQFIVRALQFIVPPLLPENFLLVINIRMKHCVQIHVHQILKILAVTARHRINRLIGISHGI